VSQVLGLKVHDVAEKMRFYGVLTPLTVKDAKRWKRMESIPPNWILELQIEKAESNAHRWSQTNRKNIESEHKQLILRDKVEQRLLRGAHQFRNSEAEFIACDIAFRAMKELVRACGEVSALLELEVAALRWAGVDPADQSTWLLINGSDA
jgi:hypothetical protein